jgi:[ribosomal protein S18]-alanine N-acetyltransferase
MTAPSLDLPAPEGALPTIRPLATDAEAARCARLMAASEPWLTLGRTYDAALALLRDPSRETYVAALEGEDVAGFLILLMTGALVGYIQTVCVAPEHRGRGLGSRLVGFAEERIFRESPNVFLCVSSFNPRARGLYLRLGYREVGELADLIVPGHSEILLRKSLGPLQGYRSSR